MYGANFIFRTIPRRRKPVARRPRWPWLARARSSVLLSNQDQMIGADDSPYRSRSRWVSALDGRRSQSASHRHVRRVNCFRCIRHLLGIVMPATISLSLSPFHFVRLSLSLSLSSSMFRLLSYYWCPRHFFLLNRSKWTTRRAKRSSLAFHSVEVEPPAVKSEGKPSPMTIMIIAVRPSPARYSADAPN